MKKITIHTDGGCEGNPGPGGWAAVLRYGTFVTHISGGELATTNNRMELQAAISALSKVKEPCEIELFTDSAYLKNGVTEWLPSWKARGWRTVEKKPVKNEDLWRKLDQMIQGHRIHWRWLKGHAGHSDNERCDRLAGAEIAKIRQQHSSQHLAAAKAAFEITRSPEKAQGLL